MSATSNTEVITLNAQTAVAKAVMATGGTLWGFSSWPLSQIAALVTTILVVLQIGLLIPKYRQLYRAWRYGRSVDIKPR